MLRDLIDVWHETVEELGGIKGFCILMVGMMIFTQVVNWFVSRRHVRKNFQRMNAERLRKAKGK